MTSISDTNVVNAPGGLVEVAFQERTNDYIINSTTVSGASNIFSSNVVFVADGSPYVVDFTCGRLVAAGPYVNGYIVDGSGNSIAMMGLVYPGDNQVPVFWRYRYVPPAGTVVTLNARAIYNTAGNASLSAGNGAGGNQIPIQMRVSKVIQASQLIVQTPNAPLVTSLPSNAIDGQEVRYLADNTNGIVWNFRYRAGSSSAYKWEFIGGPALRSSVASVGRQTNLNVFENLNGPTITVPLAGDYDLVAETGWNDANDSVYLMQILAGSTGIQTARMRQIAYGGGEVVLTSRALAIAASTLIRPQYYIQVAQAVGYGWGASSIAATPIRVSA